MVGNRFRQVYSTAGLPDRRREESVRSHRLNTVNSGCRRVAGARLQLFKLYSIVL